jgi:hypothetical protein
MDRYGPARRRRLLTDPLVVGGAFFGKGAGVEKEDDMVGKEASLRIVGRQVGKTVSSRRKVAYATAVGTEKTAHALAAAGDREFREGSQEAALRGAMGAFERAWVKAGWADMSPAPATSYAPQGAALPLTGTAPHASILSAMQGSPAAPAAPAVAPPQPLTTSDGRTPGFTNPMPGSENPLGAGTLAYGGKRVLDRSPRAVDAPRRKESTQSNQSTDKEKVQVGGPGGPPQLIVSQSRSSCGLDSQGRKSARRACRSRPV